MKLYSAIILATMLLTPGCETVYHHNTVYQLDAVEGDDSTFEFLQLDTGLHTDFKANNCTTNHYKDLKPYDFRPSWCEEHENGFCCAWVTYSSPSHTCEEEWCYTNDICDWDLIGWGDVCFANPEKHK
jgi:hypothetical protein